MNISYIYITTLPIPVCVKRINTLPHTFETQWTGIQNYDCQILSTTMMKLTFKGGRFGKIKNTQFIAVLSNEGNQTIILLRFQHELFGFPPMVSVAELDDFMLQKVNALRKE